MYTNDNTYINNILYIYKSTYTYILVLSHLKKKEVSV